MNSPRRTQKLAAKNFHRAAKNYYPTVCRLNVYNDHPFLHLYTCTNMWTNTELQLSFILKMEKKNNVLMPWWCLAPNFMFTYLSHPRPFIVGSGTLQWQYWQCSPVCSRWGSQYSSPYWSKWNSLNILYRVSTLIHNKQNKHSCNVVNCVYCLEGQVLVLYQVVFLL